MSKKNDPDAGGKDWDQVKAEFDQAEENRTTEPETKDGILEGIWKFLKGE